MTSSNQRKGALSVFSLTMITVGSVDSIRNLPATALFGSQLIAFFILGALFFLIPAALVSAELSSGSRQGGVYSWVKQAFGDKLALFAIWFQWIENVIWYPTILSFVAGTIGYLINPALVHDKYFLIATILAAFWGATLVNLRGMRSSAMFSNICAVSGLLLPMTLIIGLGAAWYFSGQALQVHFTTYSIIPQWHDQTMWVSLTGIMLSFCGVEIATVHANDVEQPQRAFPRALLYSVIIILTTLILGSLAIAIVLPQNQISLVAGIMQAFHAFFATFHLLWMMPVVAVMLILGGLGGVSNWIIAPTKGLLVAANDGHLPAHCAQTNEHGAPANLLIYQALIVSLLSLVFLLMPSVNSSYWILTALAAQLYMLMYLLMFAAGIALSLRYPEQPRAFKIPGGKLGMIIVAGLGIIGVSATIVVSFIPPESIYHGTTTFYETILTSGLVLMCLPPFVALAYRRRQIESAI